MCIGASLYQRNSLTKELIFANKVSIPTVIDLANELGFSIGVFNVPFITPPFKVRKGFIVAGFPLSKTSRFAYPDSLLEELRKSANALREQNNNLQKQNFENTFFNMLKLHNQIRNEVFDVFINIPTKLNHKMIQDNAGGLCKKPENRQLTKYLFFYEKNEFKIGHYFRNIYQILKFVSYSDSKNKKFYTNILRAQFSTMELEFLLFHCLSSYGKDKFKPLLEEFEFLEPLFLDENYLFEEINLYDIKVFGQNKHSLKIIAKLRSDRA